GLDDLAAAGDVVHALNHAATRGQVAHDRAGVVLGGLDLDGHHGLEQHRTGLAHAVLEGHRCGHAEGVFVRVHVVVGTEEQRHLDVDHRVAGHHTRGQGILDALV